MYTNKRQKGQNLDPSLFIHGMKGSLVECNPQPTLVQFHKYISHAKGYFNLNNLIDSMEGGKLGKTPQTHRNTPKYEGFKLKKENNQLVVMNRSDASNSQNKCEDSESIIAKASCLSQDSCDVSLIYSCSPQSLPCLINSEYDAIAGRDTLSGCTNYCIPYDGDSDIYSENDLSIMNFFNRLTLLKNNMIDYNSSYNPQYLDISFSFNDKCKKFNNLKIKEKVKHQEIQTSSDLLNPDVVDRQAFKKLEVIDSTINKSQNSDKLYLINKNDTVSFSDSLSDFDSQKKNFPDCQDPQNHQKSVKNVSTKEVIVQQLHPYRLISDNGSLSADCAMSFESDSDFNDECYELKKNFVEEMKTKYKEAIKVITNNKLEYQQKSEIFESFGENENSNDNYVYKNSSSDLDKFVPLPSTELSTAASPVAVIPENVLSSNSADMPLKKKLPPKHTENVILNDNNIVTKNKSVKSTRLESISKLKHVVRKVNSKSCAQGDSITSTSPLTERRDDLSLPTDFFSRFTDYPSSSKKPLNCNITNGKENGIHEFLDYIFEELVGNTKSLESGNDGLIFTPTDDLKLQTSCQKLQERLVSEKIVLNNGEPAVLFNRCGFPLTDLKGRKLKNIFGTELLPVNNMEELISSQLLVYDCFNVSIKDKNFNPINGLKKKIIQIVGKNNEPTHLYNSLGYPLNDEDGVLLYDSRGNLMVILDNSGSPSMCINNDSIYLKDGTSWTNVKDYYNVFHYAKNHETFNSPKIFEKNNHYNSIESYHLPVIEEFFDLEAHCEKNHIKTVVSETNNKHLSTHMEQLSGFSQIISEIELSLKVSDHYKSLLKEHIKCRN